VTGYDDELGLNFNKRGSPKGCLFFVFLNSAYGYVIKSG